MKNTYNFLAFDIGATSGRSIIGKLENGKLTLEELTRFDNKIQFIQDKYYWNIFSLFEELKNSLKKTSSLGVEIDSVGIDTWGVDFVYVAEDGSILNLPRSYRDPYTDGIPEEYFSLISKKEVYDLTGIQTMNFNSLFQLYAAKKENSSALAHAKNILFVPDALSYLLTGKKVIEYTIASTSQLLNARTKEFEPALFEKADISSSLVNKVTMPGSIIGNTAQYITKECNIKDTPVVAVAGHDTASAVVAVPAKDENFAYLSSGTWSLMGIETKEPIINEESFNLNFTNEGGVDGTIRFLKNITGMWLLEQCRKEWEAQGKPYSYPEIVEMAKSEKELQFIIDPDDASFANPDCMEKAISEFCIKTNQECPKDHAQYVRCIFDSLAIKYRYVLAKLQEVAPFSINKLHVIGGGAQNKLLNQLTADAIGIPVVAGPVEATAIGNIMMQAKGLGVVNSLQEIRTVINNSVSTETFLPKTSDEWKKQIEQATSFLSNIINK
ncbi:rhamnulokinase family protein [Dysgonomonas sp. Marseille-P4361]|uniref:rhamnulokinase n=1 Tax=Dysgonomonas sp. Marseille-P4361 TaxID=2161820 RepID=UPI000D56114A|nr:rhamnulokinase family protein [Dysgonomonas sp. Marseille-P4361]